ncbi:hypothetical protein K1719_021476 [Acacia pycnantha]|nr:hypothetical protein K1719_021476 [Acacia pycnantha]
MEDEGPRYRTREQNQNMRCDQQLANLENHIEEICQTLANLVQGNHHGCRRHSRSTHSRSNQDSSASDPSASSNESIPHDRRRRKFQDDFRDVKIEHPEFDGSLNPDIYLNWVRSIERTFEAKDFDDENCFKISSIKLKKYASIWFKNLKMDREGKRMLKSWAKLKWLIDKRFLPLVTNKTSISKLLFSNKKI